MQKVFTKIISFLTTNFANIILPALLVCAIAVMIVTKFAPSNQNTNPNQDGQSGTVIITDQRQEIKEKMDEVTSDTTIALEGYGRYTVTSEKHSIELHNPDSNPCFFQYTLTDVKTGNVIAKTAYVAPGEYAYVKMTDYYAEAGEYEVQVHIDAFDKHDTQLNGFNQTISVTVE